MNQVWLDTVVEKLQGPVEVLRLAHALPMLHRHHLNFGQLVARHWLRYSEYSAGEISFVLRQLRLNWRDLVLLVSRAYSLCRRVDPSVFHTAKMTEFRRLLAVELIRRLVQYRDSDEFHHASFFELPELRRLDVVFQTISDLTTLDSIAFCTHSGKGVWRLPSELQFWIRLFGFGLSSPSVLVQAVRLTDHGQPAIRMMSSSSQLHVISLPDKHNVSPSHVFDDQVVNFNIPMAAKRASFYYRAPSIGPEHDTAELSSIDDISNYIPVVRNYELGTTFTDGGDSSTRSTAETVMEHYLTLFINIQQGSTQYGKILAHVRSPSVPTRHGWCRLADSWADFIQMYSDWMVFVRTKRVVSGSELYLSLTGDEHALTQQLSELDLELEDDEQLASPESKQSEESATMALENWKQYVVLRTKHDRELHEVAPKLTPLCPPGVPEKWWTSAHQWRSFKDKSDRCISKESDWQSCDEGLVSFLEDFNSLVTQFG